MNDTEFHTETIRCPDCNKKQSAKVKHTLPFYTFIHTCEKCGYVIMESEWNDEIKPNFNDQGRRPSQREGSYKISFLSILMFVALIAILFIAQHCGWLPTE